MKRLLLILGLLLGPSLLVMAGCEQEVRTYDRKVTVQESEPRMVSPGTDIVE